MGKDVFGGGGGVGEVREERVGCKAASALAAADFGSQDSGWGLRMKGGPRDDNAPAAVPYTRTESSGSVRLLRDCPQCSL